jgi:EAL domain-containing protein (putative c-di-GMP-specific phosphodiesterase class I)
LSVIVEATLSRIIELEPSVVKLDRQLIAGLDRSRRQQTLVRHMVRLCEELGADIVAEGIEREEELAAVRDSGARYAQGLLIGRPAHTPLPRGKGYKV